MASKKNVTQISLKPLDALFGSFDETQTAIQQIALENLHPFEHHPFKVLDDDKMMELSKSVLLMGPVGTGKSFMAGCIANDLLEQGERVMMTNFSRILNELTKYQVDKNLIVQDLVDYPLLIIDDLGIERNSEFSLEQIYNVIDSRYRKMKPLIITTNLGLTEMKDNSLDISHKRIYSRILEMCVPVFCGGEDKRKNEGTEKLRQMQELLKS